MKYTRRVTIRLTEAQYNRLGADGVTRPEWVREILNHLIERDRKRARFFGRLLYDIKHWVAMMPERSFDKMTEGE